MADKSRTFGLEPKELAYLFSIGTDCQKSETDVSISEQKAELLQDRLKEPLLIETSHIRLVAGIPGLADNIDVSYKGKTISDLLLSHATDISQLKRIKNFSQKLSQETESAVEKDTAVTLYYAAIASALLFHSQKISSYDHENLRKAFNTLQKKEWMSKQLSDLFRGAAGICKDPLDLGETNQESQEKRGV